jgi:Mn2+/Fe2+ NRAMP family transporter
LTTNEAARITPCRAKPSHAGRSALEASRAVAIVGLALDFTSIDPIKALFWSALINDVAAVPIMVLMMLMASNPKVMGTFLTPMPLRRPGWFSTGVMSAAVIAMIIFILKVIQIGTR